MRVYPEISPSVRVSVGDYSPPFLTLFSFEFEDEPNQYFAVLHERGQFPTYQQILTGSFKETTYRRSVQIEPVLHEVILEGIKKLESGNSHLNPPSFLQGWALAKGYDLEARRII
ncbi:hypothetical protein NVP1170O_018 [Vibrio phage 1.170.O._10N.261.52.C3]|nr:hypothetical protein NVP1170O_018 [Vibrio phage 1.170.O._10N.261.52.C3]